MRFRSSDTVFYATERKEQGDMGGVRLGKERWREEGKILISIDLTLSLITLYFIDSFRCTKKSFSCSYNALTYK